MRHIREIFLSLALIGALSFGCIEEEITPIKPDGVGLRILPLGDSRVEGARPEFESYRYELWRNIVGAGWQFDFVGTRKDPANYPAFQGQSFDVDHLGIGGATTVDMLDQVRQHLTPQNAPGVVLLGIGGNDLIGGATAAQTLDNIGLLINALRDNNDSISIFLEQIAPGMSEFMTPELQERFLQYNAGIKELGDQKNTSISPIVVVDMAIDWQDAYMADEVHYNEAGAKVVADRYWEVMQRVLEP